MTPQRVKTVDAIFVVEFGQEPLHSCSASRAKTLSSSAIPVGSRFERKLEMLNSLLSRPCFLHK
jgi:hypothetical protein